MRALSVLVFLSTLLSLTSCNNFKSNGLANLADAHTTLMTEFTNDDWTNDSLILIPDLSQLSTLPAQDQKIGELLLQAKYGEQLKGAYELSYSRRLPPADNVSVRVFEFKKSEDVKLFAQERLGSTIEDFVTHESDDGSVTLINDRTGKVIEIFDVYYVSVFRLGDNKTNTDIAKRFRKKLSY